MVDHPRSIKPKNYFLNEAHHLAPIEKSGGGRQPKFMGVSWPAKAKRLSTSIDSVAKKVTASRDPLKEDRYFVVATPVAEITKKSSDKHKAVEGVISEKPEFGGAYGKVFERLGLDLLEVTADGKAVVHARKSAFEQLQGRAKDLERLGAREQARWIPIDEFEEVPIQLRVDDGWIRSLARNAVADVVVELQPVLSRVEADRVLRAIADLFAQQSGEKLTGTGTDFSGRVWFRGRAFPRSIQSIARDFYSVQSLHTPQYSVAAGKQRGAPISVTSRPPQVVNPLDLPCVAVVDLGVPVAHKQLGPYRRGSFVPLDAAPPPVGDHGAFVASRVVFGHHRRPEDLAHAAPTCSYFDAMVGDYPDGSGFQRIHDKVVMDALRGVRGAAPDVRAFNLSFGDTRPIRSLQEVERRESMLLMQDLDNFAAVNDCLVVVAAGNSRGGQIPSQAYPNHHHDPAWGIGAWACGFNTLVCGAYVDEVSSNGLVTREGWPSPFCRIGPGFCGGPVPSFAAPGGNYDITWNSRPGLGVLGFSGSGLIEDRGGTSNAAPILAREGAIALHELAKYCPQGAQPFAVTARALLTICAEPTTNDGAVEELAGLTLGNGRSSAARLFQPKAGSALIIWQGHIDSPDEKVRVQLPVPLQWLKKANAPVLRLVVCWDPPVNAAATATWACRRVKPVVHFGPDAEYVPPPRGSHQSFPVIDRRYKLRKYQDGEKSATSDMWLIELGYEETFQPPPGIAFDPRQRVAFAAELLDAGEEPVDPQAAMQSLPIANTLVRLSSQPQPIRTPVVIRPRL